MITRLRPEYSDEELAKIYAKPHDHSGWKDHRQRVKNTIALAKWFENVTSIADLACGDGFIIDALDAPVKYKGDFAPGYEICGAIEDTILGIPNVDLFICSETIEHVNNPIGVLSAIRAKARFLILTTPNDEDNAGNPQHYWGWNMEDMKYLLERTGWKIEVSNLLCFSDPSLNYDYQMWACS